MVLLQIPKISRLVRRIEFGKKIDRDLYKSLVNKNVRTYHKYIKPKMKTTDTILNLTKSVLTDSIDDECIITVFFLFCVHRLPTVCKSQGTYLLRYKCMGI